MTTLAINGGTPAIRSKIARFNTIGEQEISAVEKAMRAGPLSGYLAGDRDGGTQVYLLEREFAVAANVKHAIACNSATSGLLAACAAIGVKQDTPITVPCFTMSATAAAPALLGADLTFGDVDPQTYLMQPQATYDTDCFIVTNLFGCGWGDEQWQTISADVLTIEDNAQAPFATYDENYTGTIGDIGVWSFNVHKHLQCGEGGMVTTDHDKLAVAVSSFINHGEVAGHALGLNLRMTETTAAIARVQLAARKNIIGSRVSQAIGLTTAALPFYWLRPPSSPEGNTHVYYHWPFQIDQDELKITRMQFIAAMNAEGFPLHAGYVQPLYHLPAFKRFGGHCPTAEWLWEKDLLYFSNCQWTLTDEQIGQFGEALKKIADNIETVRKLPQ